MRHLTRGFNGATIDWSHDLLTTAEQGIFALMRASLLAPFS
jgi:hypothetical protein